MGNARQLSLSKNVCPLQEIQDQRQMHNTLHAMNAYLVIETQIALLWQTSAFVARE